MTSHASIRRSIRSVLFVAAATGLCLLVPVANALRRPVLQTQESAPPAPIERRSPQPRPLGNQHSSEDHRGARGEHLAEWMNQHSNLTPQEQQQALQHEPGFGQLPRTTQQRMLDRLAQLDAMNPRQRQRVLARTESMEKLNPDQRAEVRGAMSQLGSLPVEDRRAVARTFRALRELPPEQRVQAYASGQYGPALSDTQRTVLFDLLRVEPMLPPAALPPAAPPPGGIPGQALH